MEFLSQEKVKELKKELDNLINFVRKDVVDDIEQARQLGDLKENAEYHSAKDRQGKIEDRIMEIQEALRKSKIISHKDGGEIVEIGSSIEIKNKKTSQKLNLKIVGFEESNPLKGLISNHSPLAVTLLGLSKDAEFQFKQNNGETINYLITKVH